MAVGELGQEVVACRPLVDQGRVTEADVHGGLALHPVERAVQRLQAIVARLLGPGLHVGLVDLHHVGAGGEQVVDLGPDRIGVVERQAPVVRIEVVLGLLLHGEGARDGDLHRLVGVGLEELQRLDFHRPGAADLAGDARGVDRVAGAVERLAGIGEVDPLQRVGEAVGVALAPDFAVGDDVEARPLLVADGDEGGVVLGLLEQLRRHAP